MIPPNVTVVAVVLGLLGPALAAAPAGAAAAETPRSLAFPVDRAHRYLWMRGDAKIGETSFRVRKLRDATAEKPAADSFELATRRRMESDRKVQESEGTLRFRADGQPLSFREKTSYTVAAEREFRGDQELRIDFTPRTAAITYYQNGKLDRPTEHEVALEGTTFLYGTLGIEHWNLFLKDFRAAAKVRIELLLPEFAKVATVEFTARDAAERVRVGEREVAARRYDFTVTPWTDWKGSVWLDADGRMLQYESGGLRVVLAALP